MAPIKLDLESLSTLEKIARTTDGRTDPAVKLAP
jgi:hypothetical protein